MIAVVEWSSAAFDAGYRLHTFAAEPDTASVIERSGRRAFPSEWASWLPRDGVVGKGIAGQVTSSLPGLVGCSHFEDSSTAFAPEDRGQDRVRAYMVRIDALRAHAAQDGYHLNAGSEQDFWDFVLSEPRIRKGNLVLVDNGNLRAVWKNDEGTRLGLQFLGGGMVQHVIFKRREAAQLTSRVAGRDTFQGVRRQIDAFELDSLLYE